MNATCSRHLRPYIRQMNRRLSRPVSVPWKPPENARGHDTDILREIVPELGFSLPLIRRIMVDLPAPFFPMIPTFSPGLIMKFTSLSTRTRSEEHTSELQSLMRNSYAVFCL